MVSDINKTIPRDVLGLLTDSLEHVVDLEWLIKPNLFDGNWPKLIKIVV